MATTDFLFVCWYDGGGSQKKKKKATKRSKTRRSKKEAKKKPPYPRRLGSQQNLRRRYYDIQCVQIYLALFFSRPLIKWTPDDDDHQTLVFLFPFDAVWILTHVKSFYVVNRFQHLDHEIFQFLFSFHAVLLCVCRKSKKIIIKNFNEKKKIKKLFDSHMEERWESKRYRYGRELLVIKKKTTKIAKEQTYNLCI